MAPPAARSRWLKLFVIAAVVVAGRGPRPAIADGPEAPAARAGTLDELRARYNPLLVRGLVRLRAPGSGAGEEQVVGDSTDGSGMLWTKCTNLGLDLLTTLVAEELGLMSGPGAREHVRKVLGVLGRLPKYHGIFPEIIVLDGGPRAEVKDGRVRYSSLDSAWVTVALTLVQARYQPGSGAGKDADLELTARAQSLVAVQDYGVFLEPDGLLGAGLWVDAGTRQVAARFGFSYGDRNSEARALILALVGLGKLPSAAFDNMRTTWTLKEGLPVIRGWQSSAFVEMTGELWFDEMALAPLSLGLSHTNYLEATTRVARRLGHAVWGYAPACDVVRGYSEYGLDRAELVSPYAAGLLVTTGDPRAVANLDTILAALRDDGRPLPDGLDPRTGQVACEVARTLDQSLLFLSLNAPVVRALARRTAWYPSAVQRTRALDQSSRPPGETVPAPPGASALPGATRTPEAGSRAAGPSPSPARLLAVQADVRRSAGEAGGATDVARGELDLVSATAARSWADFVPDLGLALRHPLTTSLIDPRWRLIVQAQAALSLDKLWAARAAGDARTAAEASFRQHERGASARGLEGYLALFLTERRVGLLREHRASLATFASGLSAGEKAGTLDDLVLLKSRESAVDAAIAGAEADRRLALGRLRALTGGELTGSGLDPHLDLASVLALVEAVTPEGDESDQAAIAEIAQHRSLLSRVASQAPYVPELRAGAFVDVPRAVGGAPRWAVDRVTGSLSLAFDVRPGLGQAREAEGSAIENRSRRLDQLRQSRAARVGEARTRLRARLAAWSLHPEAIAEALYRDAGQRLKHGEVDVGTLIGASRALVDAWEAAERTFGEAVAAAVALCVLGVRPLSPGGAEGAGLPTTPGLRAAAAETARARAEAARTRADWWHVVLEAGVAYPLHTRGTVSGETVGPPTTLGAGALSTERIGEPTLLGRLSLELKGNRAADQAASAEAELRAAEEELARKDHLARQAGARLDLAFARTLARAAGGLAASGAEQLRLAQRMQREGLSDEKNAVREAELRATVARGRWLEAEEAVQQAAARTNSLLGRPAGAPFSIDETPAQLMAWLRGTHYPSHGLVGYRRDLGARIARLEERRDRTRLTALQHPASVVDFTVQTTEQLRGYGHSVGLALGLRLDPIKNPAQILEAAGLAGDSEGRIQGQARRIEVERRVAQAELETAAHAQALALASRSRLTEILEELRKNQAALPELNAAAKARSLGAVEAQLEEAELRSIETSARLARAELAVLERDAAGPELAVIPGAGRETPLEVEIARLVATDPEVDAAAGADREVALALAQQRPGLLAGLHLAGPFLGGAYGAGRFTLAAPPSLVTLRDTDGFVGAGIKESAGESLAFLGTRHQARAAGLGLAAARERAATRALTALGDLASARAQARSAAVIAAESRRRLDDLAVPRYHAAQISAESLADVAVAADRAAAAQGEAEGLERQERAALGISVSDRLLDELQRRTGPETVGSAQAALARWEETALAAGAGAARARWQAARTQAVLAYSGLLGPTTLLLELDPQRRRTTMALEDGTSQQETAHLLAVTSSLFVPLRLKALAEGHEAGAGAGLRGAEAAAAERASRVFFGELRLRLSVAADAWQAAEQARRDASLAFAEVGRRYRGALGGADANRHAQAQDDLFVAEERARVARGALTTLLAPLQRHLP